MSKVRLSAVRAAVIDYFADVTKHIDFTDMRDCGDGEYIVKVRGFAEVSGFEKLGSGCYSDVYAIDDERALKIVKKEDKGYEKFAQICKANPRNPYLPRIFLSAMWAGKQIYIIERLSDTNPNPIEGATRWGRAVSDKTKDFFRDAVRCSNENPFFAHANPDIAKVASLLQGMTNDLHDGNIMFRGSTPVVTDPSTNNS